MRPWFALPLVLGIACSDSTLSVQTYAPEAEIVSHEDGGVVREGDIVTFRGIVTDKDDTATELLASWLAGNDYLCPAAAPLEDGSSICQGVLDPSDTEISLIVQDPQNQIGEDHISLTVSPTDAPTVDLTAPLSDGVYYSDRLIGFVGTISDTEDAPGDLQLVWNDSLNGEIAMSATVEADGSVEGYSMMSEGQHYVTLTVTDSAGKSASDSVIFDVGPPNTAPGCVISNPVDGSAGSYGSDVDFRAVVSDADIPADWLAVDWTSDKDGPMGSSTPDSAGNVAFTTSALSTGTHTVTLTATDELGLTCSTFIQYSVSTPPVLTVLTPSAGDVYEEGEVVLFFAEVVDAEDPATDLSFEWVSTLDGLISTQGADSSGDATFSLGTLSRGEHSLVVTVTDTTGLTDRELVVFTVNGKPSAPTVSIGPDPAVTADDLAVSIDVASIDPDGDPITYAYEWYQNGVYSTASSTAALPATATAKGDTWRVVVTPSDATHTGAPGEDSITIGNTPPTASSVTISPDPAIASDTLSCSLSGYSDADGDPDLSTFAWSVNGTTVATTTTLAGYFGSGDTVVCTITPYDGTDTGLPLSDSIVIGNTPPEIAGLSLSPSSPSTDDTLTATVGTFDADGDSVSVSYSWAIDGVTIGSTASALSGTTWFDRGQVVEVTVTPYDGTDYGTPASASVSVDNTAPGAPSVVITPDPPAGNDDLLCEIDVDSIDPDADSVSYTFSWTVDGTAYTGATTTYETGDTIDASATTRGEVWTCTVTPHDGYVSGTSASYSVTISTGSCDAGLFSGTYGTSWTKMGNNTGNYNFSFMTYMPEGSSYLWNSYGTRMQYYNPATNAWATVASSTPCNGVWNSMAPYDDKLWMIRCGKVYSYDPAVDTWATLATYSGADDYNQTVADCDGNIYGHAANGTIVHYNVDTGVVAQYAHGRGSSLFETRLAYDATEDAVYFGGFAASALYRMDASTHTFSTKTSIPEYMLNDIFCADNSGHLYAAGGSSGTSLWQYNMSTDAWAMITSFPVDHGNNGSCTVSGDGYLYMSDYDPNKFYSLPLY